MVKMSSRVRPKGILLRMLPFTLHMGSNGDIPRTSGRLLGTYSGRNFSEWVGAYLATKKKIPSKVLTVKGSKYFLQVCNEGRGDFVELGHFYKHFVKNSRIKSSAETNFGFFSPRYS